MRPEDKEDLIQDIIIKLYKKEKEGILSSIIEENKNYIFISIRNEIHYRLYTKKNLVDYNPEFKEDLISFNPTIEIEIDKGLRYKQLQTIFKSNNFTDVEKRILYVVMTGNEPSTLVDELKLTKTQIYTIYGNLKKKIITELFPSIKYLLIKDGKTFSFKSKTNLAKEIKTDMATLNTYLRLKKLKHKNYEIKVL